MFRRALFAILFSALVTISGSLLTDASSLAMASDTTPRNEGPVAKKVVEFRDNWEVWSLAFSPDASKLAAGSTSTITSDQVHIWNWTGRSHIATKLTLPRAGTINGLRFSPDGSLLVGAHYIAEQNSLFRVWSVDTGSIVQDVGERGGGGSRFPGMAFSADGRLFFRSQQVGKGSADNLVVHDTSTWNQLWGLQTAPVQPETLALSSDGKAIALGGNERVVSSDGKPYLQPKLVIVDTDSRTLLRSFNVLAPGCEVQFVAWRPGSRIVAVGGRPVFAGGRLSTAAVGIFDADTGTLLGEYTHAGAGHQQGLAYTPDGRYLIIAWDGVVEIWDGQHTALRQSIATDAGAVSVSRDGRYLGIGGLDKSITVWELR